MKRLLFALILCGAICCLPSCDKIGDDESDGSENGGKPITPNYKEYKIDEGIIYRDSIKYDNSDSKQEVN